VISYDDVRAGDELPARDYQVQRINLVMYCGASGDFNVIHWNERIARLAGLPDVIAHGMYTMAQAARVLTDWAGDPGRVVDYTVRFSKPVVVPDDDLGTTLTVSGVVEEKLGGNLVRVGVFARTADGNVLTGARATVRLP
jgi:acyl dehydratase